MTLDESLQRIVNACKFNIDSMGINGYCIDFYNSVNEAADVIRRSGKVKTGQNIKKSLDKISDINDCISYVAIDSFGRELIRCVPDILTFIAKKHIASVSRAHGIDYYYIDSFAIKTEILKAVNDISAEVNSVIRGIYSRYGKYSPIIIDINKTDPSDIYKVQELQKSIDRFIQNNKCTAIVYSVLDIVKTLTACIYSVSLDGGRVTGYNINVAMFNKVCNAINCKELVIKNINGADTSGATYISCDRLRNLWDKTVNYTTGTIKKYIGSEV